MRKNQRSLIITIIFTMTTTYLAIIIDLTEININGHPLIYPLIIYLIFKIIIQNIMKFGKKIAEFLTQSDKKKDTPNIYTIRINGVNSTQSQRKIWAF